MSVYDSDPAWDLIEGALDTHIHTAPDLVERNATDLQLARAVLDADMAGAVVKSHVVPTVARTNAVNECLGETVLYGGVALNGSVGGLNPDAVEVALGLGAEVVWLPTAWAENHASAARAAGEERFVGQRVPGPDEDLNVLSDGDLRPSVERIVEMVGEADSVLATGHVSPEEVEAVAEACADAGTDCVVTHPFFRLSDLSIETQARLADVGATMEYCAFATHNTEGHTVERVAEAVQELGPERTVLATDFGQASNPPVDGLACFAGALRDAGLPESAIRTGMTETPRQLLGV